MLNAYFLPLWAIIFLLPFDESSLNASINQKRRFWLIIARFKMLQRRETLTELDSASLKVSRSLDLR